MIISNIANLDHIEMGSQEKYSLSAVLSAVCGFKDIFITHEILPAGRKDSCPHGHSKKEEMIYVLQGNPTVHIGAKSSQLTPGDFIGIAPSTEPHYLENLTAQDVRILKICSNPADDAINFYNPRERA